MSTNQLYIILADYSNDLNRLKKRDGQLPAQAAVKRIEAIIVDELRAIRTQYDNMEMNGLHAGYNPEVSWRGWKGVRNVITDRIEELTGDRT